MGKVNKLFASEKPIPTIVQSAMKLFLTYVSVFLSFRLFSFHLFIVTQAESSKARSQDVGFPKMTKGIEIIINARRN